MMLAVFALYTFGLLVALAVTSPWWGLAMLLRGKYRAGLGERLGSVPPAVVHALGGRQTVWLHAVSVGELLAAAPLIQQLQAQLAEHRPNLRVIISTTTRTGQQLAKEKFGAENVVYYPLDLPWAIDRYLDELRPQLVVLLETEFWPNFLGRVHGRGIPIAVVNARVSDRSFPRYRALHFLWKRVLPAVNIALAQSDLDAERLEEIGIPAGRVHQVGNLKYDAPVANARASVLVEMLRKHLPDGPPVWVCGSTAAGEEAAVLAAHATVKQKQPDLVLVIAPRHPERFDAVAATLPPGSVRRSEWVLAPQAIAPGSVFLLDSVGELADVYALAYMAFVGGSLFKPGGGQNPLEAAAFGIPVMAGPYMQNFRGIAKSLEGAGALISTAAETLAQDAQYLLDNPGQAFERGERGRLEVELNRGATKRTVAELLHLLPGRDIRVDWKPPVRPAPRPEPAPQPQPKPSGPVRLK